MVEFLLRKKREGRLGGIFCTTHGSPEYVNALIKSNVFDALMVAYNILGFHLLSFNPSGIHQDGRHPSSGSPSTSFQPDALKVLQRRTTYESIPRTREEVFPMARQHDIGLMIMKPLAGGLLCQDKAFPARAPLTPERAQISAREALRFILTSPEVSCVVPGTASPAEAVENALAGYGDISLPARQVRGVKSRVGLFDNTICSRCGLCDSSCSQKLPISWLFRAGYISLYPSETFEAQDEFEYFTLHPNRRSACSSCPDVTCHCARGIDIPAGLTRIHQAMVELTDKGLAPPPRPMRHRIENGNGYGATIIIQDIPTSFRLGGHTTCRLYLENTGQQPWYATADEGRRRTALFVYLDGELQQSAGLRHDVHTGERGHFVFELAAPATVSPRVARLDLVEVNTRNTVLQRLHLLQMSITVIAN
jgi:ferredoxin